MSYLVCAVPRSGSSLLCELLCLTGVAGAPTEFFDAEQRRGFERVWGSDGLDDYVRHLLRTKTSPNGVFGAKAHHPQLAETFGDRDLAAVFPDLHVVYLTRRDHLRQAISYARAIQSGRWASTHRGRGRERFRRRQIDDLLARIDREERAWERWFERHRLQPLRLDYESIVTDPAAAVAAVLELVGVLDGTPDPAAATLARQADRRTERWVRRYRRRHLDGPVTPEGVVGG
ncbi:MAG: sulfotransferase [Acidimicrobiales bacterium]|nr:sulfotransferase [Acidimicrobiales bacterium]MCB1016288.1 sulfotransferase [Acidimicrobiales bacterium]MCB9372825.1 sulfotransferase [Microthrixaceae bacterium]